MRVLGNEVPCTHEPTWQYSKLAMQQQSTIDIVHCTLDLVLSAVGITKCKDRLVFHVNDWRQEVDFAKDCQDISHLYIRWNFLRASLLTATSIPWQSPGHASSTWCGRNAKSSTPSSTPRESGQATRSSDNGFEDHHSQHTIPARSHRYKTFSSNTRTRPVSMSSRQKGWTM